MRPVKVPDLPAQPLAVVKQTPLDQPRNGVKRIVDLTPQQRSPLAQQVSEFSPLDAKFDELFSQFSANVAKRMVDAKARKQRNLRRAGIGGAIFGTAALIAAGGSTPVIMQAIEKKLDNEKVRLLDVENASAGTIEVFEPDDSGALVSLGTVEPGTTHQYTLTGPKTVTIKHSDGTVALVVNVAADTQVQIPA